MSDRHQYHTRVGSLLLQGGYPLPLLLASLQKSVRSRGVLVIRHSAPAYPPPGPPSHFLRKYAIRVVKSEVYTPRRRYYIKLTHNLPHRPLSSYHASSKLGRGQGVEFHTRRRREQQEVEPDGHHQITAWFWASCRSGWTRLRIFASR